MSMLRPCGRTRSPLACPRHHRCDLTLFCPLLTELQAGAHKDDVTPLRMSAAHLAAQGGYTSVLMVLRDWGVSMTSAADDRATPLHLAAAAGKVQAVSAASWVPGAQLLASEAAAGKVLCAAV